MSTRSPRRPGARRRDRHALLLSGQRHALLEVVRGKTPARTCLPPRSSSARPEKGARRLRRLRRLHRQPHAREVVQQSLFLLERGRDAGPGRRRAAKVGLAMGRFAMYDMAGTTWLGNQEAARKERPDMVYSKCRPHLRAGPFGQKTGKGFYRYEAGDRKPLPIPKWRRSCRITGRRSRRAAPAFRRRDHRAMHVRARQRRRVHPRGASRLRVPTSTWCTYRLRLRRTRRPDVPCRRFGLDKVLAPSTLSRWATRAAVEARALLTNSHRGNASRLTRRIFHD